MSIVLWIAGAIAAALAGFLGLFLWSLWYWPPGPPVVGQPDWIETPPVKAPLDVQQITRFGFMGVLNVALCYLIFSALILSGAADGTALVISSAFGAVMSFSTGKHFVFRSTGRALRFVMVYAACLGLNWLGLQALHDLDVGPLLAQALIIVPMAGASFLGQKHFVFAPRPV